MALNSFQPFVAFRNNCSFKTPTCLVLSSRSSLVSPVSLFISRHPVSVKLFEPSFFVIFPRNFCCLYIIISKFLFSLILFFIRQIAFCSQSRQHEMSHALFMVFSTFGGRTTFRSLQIFSFFVTFQFFLQCT